MSHQDLIEDYITAHCTPEHPYLHALWRDTNLKLLRPRMASGHVQGELLRLIVGMVCPRTVVEIGTFSGYSALAMASAMDLEGAMLHTFEINDEQEDFTRRWIDGSPWADRINFVIGDVTQILPTMGLGPIDLAFIDANKRDYRAYYDLIFPRMREGGILLADNTLWDGHVVEADRHDAQTLAIRDFNDYVAADPAAESLILPLRDGLTVIRKRKTGDKH